MLFLCWLVLPQYSFAQSIINPDAKEPRSQTSADQPDQNEEPEPLPPPGRWVYRVSPLHFTTGTFRSGVEYFAPDFDRSFSLIVGITSRNEMNNNQQGISGEIQYRRYLVNQYLDGNSRTGFQLGGAYAAGFLYAASYETNFESHTGPPDFIYFRAETDILRYGGGTIAGVTFRNRDRLYLDLYAGGGIIFTDHTSTPANGPQPFDGNDLLGPLYEGVFPKAGFNIGFHF